MKNALRIAKVGIVSMALSFGSAAHAGWVFDPTNFIQNTISAISEVSTEISAAATYAQQVKSTIELVKSTAQLENISGASGLQEEYALYNDLMNSGALMKSLMNQSLGVTRNMQAQFGASNHSWETFLNSQNATDVGRAQLFAQQYDQINQSMKATAERRKVALNNLQNATGQTAATQAVGTQIDMLIGQQQQMVNQLAQARLADSTKIEQNKASRDALNEYNKNAQKRLIDSSSRFMTPYPN